MHKTNLSQGRSTGDDPPSSMAQRTIRKYPSMGLPAPVKLPYFRNTAELLGPLPTPSEIREASKVKLSPKRSGPRARKCLI